MPETTTPQEFCCRPDAYDAIAEALVTAELVGLYGKEADEECLEALLRTK
jgi:hypothetical protein